MWRCWVLAIVGLCSCAGLNNQFDGVSSVGLPIDGYLADAERLPNAGVGYVRSRPNDDTRYGTSTLLGALTRAAADVARKFPGGKRLRIGDLSSRWGGAHPRHGSHRSGRDADVLFYSRNTASIAANNTRWLSFNTFGWAKNGRTVVEFDYARNWSWVRTLLLDEVARV